VSPQNPTAPRLILASASPRRQELLRQAGFDFLVHPADLDEDALAPKDPGSPEDYAAHLAQAKAQCISQRFPYDVILAADTVVAAGSQILNKPTDAADARRILGLLSGTTHRVITAVVLLRPPQMLCKTVASTVEMRRLGSAELEAYIASGQWQGKAGAYGIQDPDPFVTRIAGCMTNIVGLPMTTTTQMLRDFQQFPRIK
jgi:septum formation protein